MTDTVDRGAGERRALDQAVDTAHDAMLVISPADGAVIDCNQAARELFGSTPGDMVGAALSELVGKDEWVAMNGTLQRASDGAHSTDVRIHGRRAQASAAPCSANGGAAILLTLRPMSDAPSQAEECSDELLRSVLDATLSVSIVSTDLDRTIRYWNPGAERIFGYTAEEMIGKVGSDVLYPDAEARAVSDDVRERLFRSRTPATCEIREATRDGELLWMQLTLTPRFDADGEVVGILGVGVDITEQKRAAEELRETNELLRGILESSSSISIVHTDLDRNVLYWNSGAENLLGYTADEMIGKNTVDVLYVDESSRHLTDEARDMLFTAKIPITTEIQERTKDGRLVWISMTLSPSVDENGEVIGILGIGRDVTQEREAQRALLESEAQFRGVVENSPVGIYRMTPDGDLILVNPTLCGMVGCATPEEFTSRAKANGDVHLWHARPDLRGAMASNRQVVGVESDWSTADGMTIRVRESARAVLDHEGKVRFYEGTVEDITELSEYRSSLERKVAERTRELADSLERERKLSDDLQVALEKEKELSQLKSRFVSTASHEFRTPLTAILTYADLLHKFGERMTPEQRGERLLKIRQQVMAMTALLEDVLVIGRADAGRMECHPEPMDVEAFCREIVEDTRVVNEGRHEIVFAADLPDDARMVALDEKLIRHVVTNLLSNAIKYSPDGGKVDVGLSVADSVLKLRVSDQGIGIPAEDLPHLFEPFHRATNVGTFQGTGLGLSILHKAVELHGGRVDVESRVDEGTALTVTIPVKG